MSNNNSATVSPDTEDIYYEYTINNCIQDIEDIKLKHSNMELWYKNRYYEMQIQINSMLNRINKLELELKESNQNKSNVVV